LSPGLLISASLLEPVGRHRAAHTVKSSGKKSKKRKRLSEQDATPAVVLKPVEPEILKHLTVGLNTTSHHLETEAALSKPGALAAVDKDSEAEQTTKKRLAVVFLPKPKDNLVYSHLPLLCYTSSTQKDKTQHTRLVLLDPSCERIIATAMGLPRAGVIGVLEDAPGASPLIEYVRENVDPVEVPWLEKALSGQWMGMNVETHVPGQV
jgi:ribonuclease P/MRP protein subunit POP3